jgi:hypothetical protein
MSADEPDIWLADLRRPLRWPGREAFDGLRPIAATGSRKDS